MLLQAYVQRPLCAGGVVSIGYPGRPAIGGPLGAIMWAKGVYPLPVIASRFPHAVLHFAALPAR